MEKNMETSVCAPTCGSLVVLSLFQCPSRLKRFRKGPNISCKCWVFLCLRRELQHNLGTGCVTQVSSASTQLYLGPQAKKVLTVVRKERTKAKVRMSSYWTQFFTTANANHLNLCLTAIKYFCWFRILSHCLPPLTPDKVEVSLLQTYVHQALRNSRTGQCTEWRKYQVEKEIKILLKILAGAQGVRH